MSNFNCYNITNDNFSILKDYYQIASELYAALAYELELIEENAVNSIRKENVDYYKKLYIAITQLEEKINNLKITI